MLKPIAKIAIALGVLTALGLGITAITVDAQVSSITDDIAIGAQTALEDTDLTIEEMLTYALQDEYLALAEYQVIVGTYGEIRPFTNLINAETYHVSLLLPLFETYGVTLVDPITSDSIVAPDSITASIAVGISAEEANIAMYEAFLATPDLPEDVKAVFEQLLLASNRHLVAFSKDRYCGVGTDLANQFKNMFGNKGQGGNGQGNKGQGNKGQSGQSSQNGSNNSGTSGTCTQTW